MAEAPAVVAPPPAAAPAPVKELTQAERFEKLGRQLWNDRSERGRMFRQAGKEMFPDAVTPEDQIEPILLPFREEVDSLRAELKAEREARAAELKSATEAAAENRLQSSIEAAAAHFHLTEDGRQMMLARMQETGNFTDPMAAASYIVHANPPPKDVSGMLGPQNMNYFGSSEESADERIKLLHRDPQGKFLDAEFTDFLTDPRKYMRDAGTPDWLIDLSI